MLDLNQKCFGYGQLWPLWPVWNQDRTRSYMQHPTIASDSVPVCKTGPDPIWMAWSGNKPVCKNHQALFWQNATNPLPVSHFQTLLCSLGLSVEECNRVWKWETGSRPIAFCHNGAWWCLHTGLFDRNLTRITLHKTSLGTIWFWMIVSGCGQMDPVRKQASCKNHWACFWPMLQSLSRLDANQIRHVYWDNRQGLWPNNTDGKVLHLQCRCLQIIPNLFFKRS